MKINMHSSTIPLTPALQMHIEQQVDRVFARFSSLVSRVRVTLEDVNAQRGGNDKRCKVMLEMPKEKTIVGEATDSDAYLAISGAASRLARVFGARRSRQVKGRRAATDRADER